MRFTDTRNKRTSVRGAEAIVRGIGEDGGLFVPESFPVVSRAQIETLGDDYARRAANILSLYLPELTALSSYTEAAYAKFDGDPAPLVKVHDNLSFLELWHGPTHAFKDIALTVLPYLLRESKRVTGDESLTLIPVATSGDTGKAALEGFKDVDGTAVAVFYPFGGVSALQQLQMETSDGKNVFVSAIEGNFDDAQTAVKAAFADAALNGKLAERGVKLSSANSINFGRLAPQIAYYFSAYADLLDAGKIAYGDEVNFCVPSGNFGNILAGYYAYRMGLPVGKLICASNRNNVLTDFLQTGKYDVKRPFYKTTSPSMDILISSNAERLLFELCDRDDARTAACMKSLKEKGEYTLSEEEHKAVREKFEAGCASEEDVADTICETFDEYGYIMDPHTAVAAFVADEYLQRTGDTRETVVLSTASPHKFASSVLAAIGERSTGREIDDLKLLEDVTALAVPDSLIKLPQKERIFTGKIGSADVPDVLRTFSRTLKK